MLDLYFFAVGAAFCTGNHLSTQAIYIIFCHASAADKTYFIDNSVIHNDVLFLVYKFAKLFHRSACSASTGYINTYMSM